jgi:N-acetylmuramoyl-L-alanine amidase
MRLLAGVVVGVVGLGVAGRAPAASVLDAIEIRQDPAAVRLHLSGPVTIEAHKLPGSGPTPERIYLDLRGARLAPSASRLTDAGGPVLLRVRAGQFDMDTARVVLDLASTVPFDVERREGTVTIALGAPAAEPAPSPAAPAPQAEVPVPPPVEAPVALAPAPPPPPEPPPAASPSPPPAPVTRAVPRAPSKKPVSDVRPRRVASVPHPLVVLDAGHGGRDPGTTGVGGVLEKDVVLELTQVVAHRLAARLPVDVMMTRNDDSFISIGRRLALPSERATLFISIHANACTDPSARGLEVFYGGGAVRNASSGGTDPRAALLGRCLDRALQERIGGVRGGARPGGFGVLVRNPVPSALVEIGYLTHPEEAARAQDTGYQEQLADALADGIAAFLRASAPPL